MQAQTLDEWLEAHSHPVRKMKVPRPKKLGKPRGAGHDREFATLVRDYQFQVNIDRRTIREPVTLERFIELKRDLNWKPKKLVPKGVTLRKLSSGEAREIAAEWAREVARLTQAKKAA